MYPNPQRNDADIFFEGNASYKREVTPDAEPNLAYMITKRMMDFTFAMIGLIMLSPLFLIISILIKLEDPKGSVFLPDSYRKRRKAVPNV